MRSGAEGCAVADVDEHRDGGPDATAGHGGQDLGNRVGLQPCGELLRDAVPLVAGVEELAGETGDDPAEGVGAGDDDALLVQRGEDLLGQPGRELARPRGQQISMRFSRPWLRDLQQGLDVYGAGTT